MSGAEQPSLFARDIDAVWHPDEVTRQRSRLASLLRRHEMDDLTTLHHCAIDDPEFYWRAAVDHLDISFERPFARVLELAF
jgi:acetyl-CoA synthetase